MINTAERFWSRVERANGCWFWRASATRQGYGQMRYRGRLQLAHRIAWQLSHGGIPAELCVLHRCDTPACVNPAHLFLGTRQDNMTDMVLKRRSAHRYGNPSKGAMLSQETVQAIRRLVLDEGYSQAAAARKCGLHQTTVNQIFTGRRVATIERLLAEAKA